VRRSVILALSLVIGGTVGGVVLGEIMSRVLVGRVDVHFQTNIASERDIENRRGMSREDEGFRCTFDADGFRAEATPAVFDRTVLFVGDSFTQGYGVADGASFPAQTGRALARRGISARAVNAGDLGAGTAQELRLVRRLLARMRVDLIVLQVFPHNDLDDNWEDGGFTVTDGRLVEVSPARSPMRVVLGQWLRDHGHLLDLNLVRLLGNLVLRPVPIDVTDEAIELERALLRETAVTAQSAKVPLFLLVVSEPRECETLGQGMHEANDRVVAMIGSLGVPWLSSCSVTRDGAHYNQSGHFNAAGNEAIGEALAERLAPLLREESSPRTAAAEGRAPSASR
jgi:lysophospholipase L1-like esterase